MATKNDVKIIITKIVLIGAILFFGGHAAFFIMALIVCGIGFGADNEVLMFVVGIPTAIFILSIFYKVIKKILKSSPQNQSVVKTTLMTYIEAARLSKMNDQEIADTLKEQGGWTDDEIKEAFSKLAK
jgi:hypothetical protein